MQDWAIQVGRYALYGVSGWVGKLSDCKYQPVDSPGFTGSSKRSLWMSGQLLEMVMLEYRR